MLLTILIALLAIVTIAGFTGSFIAQERLPYLAAGGVAALLTLVTLALSCTTMVPTRDVGVVTTFGRPNGDLSNGLHLVAPWQDVTNMDGAIQLEKFDGDSYDTHDNAIPVRLGNNSQAYANVNINWRIDPESTPQLFMDYRTFDNIRDNLVNKELAVALNKEFAAFNPQTQAQGADFAPISLKVKDDVQAAVGNRIEIQQVFVPNIFYDSATQDRINQLNVEKQQTAIAEQAKLTAAARAAANTTLSGSVNNDPLVVIAQCINSSLDKNQAVNGCWPIGGTPLINIAPQGK